LKPCGELTKRSRLFTGYGCNIRCKFCFYKDKKHKDIKNLIYQQLSEGRRYGIQDWDISGGEPSILPYWFDLLKDMNWTLETLPVSPMDISLLILSL
jgi:MoaA/NifB/PqqE/SkfB family radical SAM enzyme